MKKKSLFSLDFFRGMEGLSSLEEAEFAFNFGCVAGGSTFEERVVEKLLSRTIGPRIRLNTSGSGLTCGVGKIFV